MLKKKITEAFEPLATLFFPPHCAHCKKRLEVGVDFCSDCEVLIERIKAPSRMIVPQANSPVRIVAVRRFTLSAR